ncbi:MAG TPA: flagellar protein FlgN [Noviherbaspirillum sp.]|nr:flagellar protein FlgN [Noviherbaspirillum sp.]
MQNFGNALADSLGEELKAGNILLQLLQQEQEHLINADLEALTRVTEEKAKIVAHMTELAQKRHRALGASGFEAGEAGMQAWLNSRAASPAAEKSWKDLLAVAQQAKELNRTNGLLIGQHMARNQNALNVLQGAPDGGAMYGPNGQSTSQSSSRRLVVG